MATPTFIEFSHNGKKYNVTIKDAGILLGYKLSATYVRYHDALDTGCETGQQIFDYMRDKPVRKPEEAKTEILSNPLLNSFCLRKPVDMEQHYYAGE